MRDGRPDPDQLLKEVQAQEGRRERGRLKVFLGASAGVGKTYAMLSEAHEQRERGVDVVVGYVETHGRKETETLSQGLECIPLRKIAYRGVFLREFDLDGALARHPDLLIVDELAHSNAPESRHPKRWQDIDELLDAGINVYTSVNVQHLESLTDVVAQITGIIVKETVPDAFIERADDIEMVDIPPEELRQRLRDGKVYVPDRIDHALEGFFKTGNLTALRELALRRAADRVDAEARAFREGAGPWATRERLLVCVAPNHLGERVVRAAARLGAASHAEMFALYVESERQEKRSQESIARAEEALRMAERLGMETARRSGRDIVGEILTFARSRNVTLIVVGKPIKERWKEILIGSVVDELVRRSGDINVHVLTGEADGEREARQFHFEPPATKDYLVATIGVLVPTAICALVERLDLPRENLVAIYLLAIAYVGSRTNPQATGLCCLLSVAAYDFFFVVPRFTFSAADARYFPTFGVMLLTALLISSLTIRLRRQAEAASERERRTSALYDLSKQLSVSRNRSDIAKTTARKIQNDLNVDAAVLLPGERGKLEVVAPSRSQFEKDLREQSVAQWCFDHRKPAGAGTDTLPGATGSYFALTTDAAVLGVLACSSMYHQQQLDSLQNPLLQTFANSLSLALERAMLAKENQQVRISAETERVRSALLSSVSHDIRTPLTVITGTAAALLAHNGDPDELARTIMDESERLNRQVRNLLDMTRLESGSVQPKLEWHDPEELTGDAIRRAENSLKGRQLTTHVAPGLPLIKADGQLIEQALTNLLENAARHTPPDTSIDVRVEMAGREVTFAVLDRGPGVPASVRAHVFEKFSQSRPDQEGFGLGLAIADSAMRVQGGKAAMEDRPGGGSIFLLTMPLIEDPPEVPIG